MSTDLTTPIERLEADVCGAEFLGRDWVPVQRDQLRQLLAAVRAGKDLNETLDRDEEVSGRQWNVLSNALHPLYREAKQMASVLERGADLLRELEEVRAKLAERDADLRCFRLAVEDNDRVREARVERLEAALRSLVDHEALPRLLRGGWGVADAQWARAFDQAVTEARASLEGR